MSLYNRAASVVHPSVCLSVRPCVNFYANRFWPTVLSVAPLLHEVVCLSVCRLSVTFCIEAKRYVLAKNCLKEQIGLPPETTNGYQFGPPIPPLTGVRACNCCLICIPDYLLVKLRRLPEVKMCKHYVCKHTE